MGIVKDITGQRFGKLTVLSHAGKDKYGNLWNCVCDCGNHKIARTNPLTQGRIKSCGCIQHTRKYKVGDRFGFLEIIEMPDGNLRTQKVLCRCECGSVGRYFLNNLVCGTSTSCGCKRSDYAREVRNCHGESTSTLYRKWSSIKTRCENPSNHGYGNYGGRGIKLCDEWQEFWPFREWAYANGYSEGLTIDRIDVNGDYCPENCRWITSVEQQSNKRTNVFIEYNGEKKTVAEWAKLLGVSSAMLAYRVKAGWTAEECLTIPKWAKQKSHN